MSRIRKNHSAEFKAQVALAAIWEDAQTAELSSRYGVHTLVIHRWKKETLSGLQACFSGKREHQNNDHTGEIKELYAKIGQLTVKRDFLAYASKRLGLF